MYSCCYDAGAGLLVGVFRGPTNDAADFERAIAAMVRLDVDHVAAGRAGPSVSILVVDPDNPQPSLAWRRRIGDARATLAGRHAFALVTQSAAIRSVVATIDWLAPPRARMHSDVFATFADAARWAELRRGERLPELARLLAEARRESAPVPGAALRPLAAGVVASAPTRR